MTKSPVSMAELAGEVAAAYRNEPGSAEAAIERLLAQRLRGLPAPERIGAVQRLTGEFSGSPSQPGPAGGGDAQAVDVSRLVTLLLGAGAPRSGMTTEEVLNRLAESMNTLFSSLNRVVTVINTTLAGR